MIFESLAESVQISTPEFIFSQIRHFVHILFRFLSLLLYYTIAVIAQSPEKILTIYGFKRINNNKCPG